MKGQFLVSSNHDHLEINIYADKSALILDWLLKEGLTRQEFSLRDVAKEKKISLGLVQKVFEFLVQRGVLQIEGIRTSKRFIFKKTKLLLENWLNHYSIIKKCKMRTYRSAFQEKSELLSALKKSKLSQNVVLALHSAAEAYGFQNTNLNTLELYMPDSTLRLELENMLQLEPQERGYEVLLIEPYYKSWLAQSSNLESGLKISPLLLTFLDLYHFPLRGQEQAEFMLERAIELKRLYKKGNQK